VGLRIRSTALQAGLQRQLAAAGERVQDHVRRLSSGLRIARAADDPAGLGISERLRGQVRARTAALRNVDDALGLVRTAQAGLGQVSGLLGELRALAVRASTGTLAPADLAALEAEWQARASAVSDVAGAATFNGQQVLGTNQVWSMQTGIAAGETVDVRGFDLVRLGSILGYYGLTAPGGPQASLKLVDRGLELVSGLAGRFAAQEHRFESTRRSLEDARANLGGARSRVRDLDFAAETAALAGARIVQQSGVALAAQAHVQPELALALLQATVQANRAALDAHLERAAASAAERSRPAAEPGFRPAAEQRDPGAAAPRRASRAGA